MPRPPEAAEPPALALGALAHALEDVPGDAWLLMFLDLVDKAEQADPSDQLVSLLHAAVASAPAADAEVARNVLRTFETGLRAELKGGQPLSTSNRQRPQVLVVVPKPLEHIAVQAVFECEDEEPRLFDSRIRYRYFPHPDKQGVMITLVCMQEEGNLLAANVVRDYVSAFGRPDLAVLCGMALGVREDKVPVGDVVVAREVWDTGPRRITHDLERTRLRAHQVPGPLRNDINDHCSGATAEILAAFDAARERVGEMLFLPDVVKDRSFRPKFHPAVVLSADELIEDESGPKRAEVHDRAYAYEMEGAGFAAACDHLNSDWTVVRGVADHGAPYRNKDWQGTATLAAAAFVRTFLAHSWTRA